jgi:hypothetical protein
LYEKLDLKNGRSFSLNIRSTVRYLTDEIPKLKFFLSNYWYSLTVYLIHISQTPGFALVDIRFWAAYLKSCHVWLKNNEKNSENQCSGSGSISFFGGLQDPDPLVIGKDPDPSIIKQK